MNRSVSSLQYLDELENALNQFHHCLGSRAAALLDCNGEIEDLSRKLEGYLEEWCPSVYPLAYDGKSLPVQDFYVIACPELHAIPAKDLYNGFVEAFVGEERRQVSSSLIMI